MTNLKQIIAEEMENLRKNSAGYGFVTDESIQMFEEQFVIPALSRLAHKTLEAVRVMRVIRFNTVMGQIQVGLPNKSPEFIAGFNSAIEQFEVKSKEFLE